MGNNLHKSNISIYSENENFEEIVSVTNGAGVVTRTPLSTDDEYIGYVSYDSVVDEEVVFTGKSFSISDYSYNGEVEISYLAKKFLMLKIFSLFVSGIAQVKSVIIDFVFKCAIDISFYSMKYINILLEQKWFNMILSPSILKNSSSNIKINFDILASVSSQKYTSSNIVGNFNLISEICSEKYSNSDVGFSFDLNANLKKIRYRTLSEYSGVTLSDLSGKTLFEFIFEEL